MKLHKDSRAGLYITVIFHLTVIIVLLCSGLGAALQKENSFVLDFTRQEEIEQREKEEAFRADISDQIDALLRAAAAQNSDIIRNIAVNASSVLKDDRGTDARQLYEDNERLQRELRGGTAAAIDEGEDRVDISRRGETEAERKEYKGASVLTYSLDGRKASRLKVPAYQCMTAGDVTVAITVDNSGRVLNAKVVDEVSSESSCHRTEAIKAARLSRFSSDPNAPARQAGQITYRFTAQQ